MRQFGWEADLLERLPDGVVVVDGGGRIVYVNRQAERLTGYERRELSGRPVEVLLAAGLRAVHREQRRSYAERPRSRPMGSPGQDFRLRRKEGTQLAVDIALGPVGRRGDGLIAAAIRDATERRRLESDLEHRALHDPLTGLANRTLLFDRLRQAMLGADRAHQHAAVVLLDLDRFKAVNDALGHVAGDAILRQLGVHLGAGLRATDSVARMGGDEFVWILPHVAGPAAAVRKVRSLLRALPRKYSIDGNEIELGVSAGMVLYPDEGRDVDTLLRGADLALYAAKRHRSGLSLADRLVHLAAPESTRSRRRRRGLSVGAGGEAAC